MIVKELFDLRGKVAIVTGGAQGLGKAMAAALVEAGASVVLADTNVKLATTAAEEISRLGAECTAIEADVTSKQDMEGMAATVAEKFGHIDILVNNAGIVRQVPAETMSLEDWNTVINVNLTGVFLCSQAVGRLMISQKRGTIINIASMSGLIVNNPQPQSSYNASKAGVIMLTKSLASEWAPHGIRVNAIAPGYIETAMTKELLQTPMAKEKWIDMTPMKRPGKPWELGGAVVYLASEASTFVTGHVMVIDGGYTVW